jgi:hypothetical protein
MTVRICILSGTAFQAVVGKAAGPAAGEMWEHQLSLSEHFPLANRKVDLASKTVLANSRPPLVTIPSP